MHTVFWPMLPQAPRTTLPQHSWAEMSVSAPVLRTQHFQSSAKWLVPTLPPPPQPHPNSHTLPQPQSQSLAPVTLAQLPPPTSASLVPRRLKTSPTQALPLTPPEQCTPQPPPPSLALWPTRQALSPATLQMPPPSAA